MAWSLLTPAVLAVLTASEAQRNEPGINQIDGCGPACVSCLMQIHGYADIEPQDLVGQYYKGGTTGFQLNAIVAKRYPNPPAMSYGYSVDPMADLARWAGQRFLAMGLFWSNSAAVVKPYNTGIGHWCIPVEDDGSAITIWNPEWGTFDRFSHADFLKASWHQFDVCQRAIPEEDHMTRGQKVNAVENWYAIYLHLNYGDPDWPINAGRGDKDAIEAATRDLNEWAGKISADGENMDGVRGEFLLAIAKHPRFQWYLAAKNPVQTAQVDTTQFAKVVHPHKVTATGEAVQ